MSTFHKLTIKQPPCALILAAGMGTRLLPETADYPKCLIEVGGKPLLQYLLLDGLYANHIRHAIIVTGYKQDLLKKIVLSWDLPDDMKITWVDNPDYQTTNTIDSVHRAASYLQNRPFMLLNGDLWITPQSLALLTNAPFCESTILVDTDIALDDEAMKVKIDDKDRIFRISKAMLPSQCQGESVGAYRFSAQCSRQFFNTIAGLISEGVRKSYYEAALELLLQSGLRPHPLSIPSCTWAEIDDRSDLKRARKYANSQILSLEETPLPSDDTLVSTPL